jgi:4-hydroxy-3-methylbut-2-en-1-yl diphosphate synthase IspG/GcpE
MKSRLLPLPIYTKLSLSLSTREEYDTDIPALEELLVPLVLKMKEKGRAMRIGTNHGSLSARYFEIPVEFTYVIQ